MIVIFASPMMVVIAFPIAAIIIPIPSVACISKGGNKQRSGSQSTGMFNNAVQLGAKNVCRKFTPKSVLPTAGFVKRGGLSH
jgi:hypothetical protein